jgi:hypothetical protein
MTKKTNLIVVDADGELIIAANGQISSDNRELVKRVKNAWFPIQLIQPFGTVVRPSRDPENLVGLTAALFSAKPGRTRLLEAPDEVWEWMKEEYTKKGGGCLPNASSIEPESFTDDTTGTPELELSKDEIELLLNDSEFYESVVAEGEKYNPDFAPLLRKAIERSQEENRE